MAGNETAQLAHDLLMAHKPDDVAHDSAACPLCPADIEPAKEVARVDRTFTEAEHAALLTDAVARETAALTESNEKLSTEKAELIERVDVLEAEKATITAERDSARQELVDFKAEVEEKEQAQVRKAEREARVRAANENLPDDYFTEQRTEQWAGMSEEAFESFVAAVEAAPVSTKSTVETASFKGGETPEPPASTPASTAFLAARRGVTKKGE